MLKLALYGLSGAGKSTTANMFHAVLSENMKNAVTLKLAQPLYELQSMYYRIAGKPIVWNQQDQQLLETIAASLRNISMTSLVDDLEKRMEMIHADVILNDDIRDTDVDYPAMKKMGFAFIHIICDENTRVQRLMDRHDLSKIVQSKTTEYINNIKSDFTIDTTLTDMESLRLKVIDVLVNFAP